MNFKPTVGKTVLSLIGGLLSSLIAFPLLSSVCYSPRTAQHITGALQACTTDYTKLFLFFIIPLIVIYIFWSFLQRK